MLLDDDQILYGVPAIADAFKLKPRQVYYLKENHGLPTFKVGRIVCAKRSAVRAWIESVAEKSAAEAKAKADAGRGSDGMA